MPQKSGKPNLYPQTEGVLVQIRSVVGQGLASQVRAGSAPEPAALATSVLFCSLEPGALLEIALAGRIRRLTKGATVFEQGAAATQVFVLLQGRAKAVQLTANGQLVTARFLGPGDPFGCVGLMAAGSYPVTVLTEVDSLAVCWDAAAMVRFAYRYPQMAMNALQYVGAQLRDVQTRLQETMTERIEQRIAHTLLRLVRQAGRRCEEGIEINFPISRQDIAEITGSRLFTVSRTLSKWQLEGVIKSGRRHIIVIAPHRLVMIAEKYSSG